MSELEEYVHSNADFQLGFQFGMAAASRTRLATDHRGIPREVPWDLGDDFDPLSDTDVARALEEYLQD
jgi:hypothetical protein